MSLLDDALSYRDRGWTAIPLINDMYGLPKRPFIDGWQRAQIGDVAGFPWDRAIGIGIVLGSASGNLAVIDIDDEELAKQAAEAARLQYFVRTARDRGHLYVTELKGASASRVVKAPYHGRQVTIELKAQGTQVAAPSSPGYSVWNDASVLVADNVAAAFDLLCNSLEIKPLDGLRSGYPRPWLNNVSVGDRNNAQFVEACRLAKAGMPFQTAVEIMRVRFRLAYEKDEQKDRAGERAMVRTIQSAYQHAVSEPRIQVARTF